MKKAIIFLVIALSLQADMFSEGSRSLGFKIGSGSIGIDSYAIAGVSGNYFVIDNLSVGIGIETWLGGSPSIQKATIESTYFIPATETFKPYVGLLYRRIFISDGFDDTSAYGYRVGISFIKENFLLSVGLVQEKYDTRQGLFVSSEVYPEFIIGISF